MFFKAYINLGMWALVVWPGGNYTHCIKAKLISEYPKWDFCLPRSGNYSGGKVIQIFKPVRCSCAVLLTTG